MRILATILAVTLALTASPSLAWGAKGHKAIGAIADRDLNPHAAQMVHDLIGMSLETAGPWLDCVKDVKGAPGSRQVVEDQRYASSCGVFWDRGSIEEGMVAYADRNWSNCASWTDANPCHSQYHFADVDVSINPPGYVSGLPGTNDHDIVHAINAAIAVLQGQPSPAPFQIADKREALLMLAHLIGDLHQPLHVGAVYLDPRGHETSATTGEEASDPGFTRGGNWLITKLAISPEDHGSQLHGDWDYVSDATVAKANDEAAQDFPTGGALTTWPAQWATDSIVVSKSQLEPLNYGTEDQAHRWQVEGDKGARDQAIASVQALQIAKGGRHLADLLNAIWP